MKFPTWMYAPVMCLFAALAMPIGVAAQDNATQNQKPKHHTYMLIDLGTFDGPNSFYFSEPIGKNVNNRGMVVGGADTSIQDPFAPNCDTPDCLILRAFEWKDGVLVDLGTLPGGYSSAAYDIYDNGLVLGGSENGDLDPISGRPENIGVVWWHGQITSLGTFGGAFSATAAANSRNEVTGIAQNANPDPFSMLGVGTETRGFVWKNGKMTDLGTLGGPDAWPTFMNDRGQIVGWSYTDAIPNSTTGIPTQHPFLWENGQMHDLGTLGGTFAVVGSINGSGGGAINERGLVIGTSNLLGDQTHHAFLWQHGKLMDFGTFGGNNAEAYWINDAGDVVGRADLPGSQSHHGFLWRNGKMIDLGAAAGWPCSTALDVNAEGEIILDTGICGVGGGPGAISENGGPIVDLNLLVSPDSDVKVVDVNYINDRGEIAATGLLPDGDHHAILLVPNGDCDDECEGRIAASQNNVAPAQYPATTQGSEPPATRVDQLRNRFGSRYHFPRQRVAPSN
jgi:probable HAF family extracellular repeat protein